MTFRFSFAGLALVLISCVVARAAADPINVRSLGAAGDGKTKDTIAFQKALDQCSALAGGGEVIVPAGNYLIGSIVLPANSTLRLEKDATLTGSPDKADYPLVDVRWEGRWRQGHRALIYSTKADHIALVGEGTIVGDSALGELRDPRGPCLFEPVECKDVRIEGLSFRYSRMWSIHLIYCQDVVARGLNMRSDPRRANGDGIDVDSSSRVRIEECDIDNGDDAIAIKSGRGMEAVRLARPSEDILITRCKLGSSFAGVGIGTEMSGGIRNVRIEHCAFTRGANAIYIKSRTGRGGFIEDVAADDLDVATGTFLGINLVSKGIVDSETVEGDAGIPRAANFRFSNVRVKCSTLVDATAIAPKKPVEGMSLSNVNGTCRKAITISNVNALTLKDVKVTGYSGALVNSTNVKMAVEQ